MHYHHIPVFSDFFQHDQKIRINSPVYHTTIVDHNDIRANIIDANLIYNNNLYYIFYNINYNNIFYSCITKSKDAHEWDQENIDRYFIKNAISSNNIYGDFVFLDKNKKFVKFTHIIDKKQRYKYSVHSSDDGIHWEIINNNFKYIGYIQSIYYNSVDDNYYIYTLYSKNLQNYSNNLQVYIIDDLYNLNIINYKSILISEIPLNIFSAKIVPYYNYFLLFITFAYNQNDLDNLNQSFLYVSNDGFNFSKISEDFFFNLGEPGKLFNIGYISNLLNHNIYYYISYFPKYPSGIINMANHLRDRITYVQAFNEVQQCDISLGEINKNNRISFNAEVDNGYIDVDLYQKGQFRYKQLIQNSSVDIRLNTPEIQSSNVELKIKTINSKLYGVDIYHIDRKHKSINIDKINDSDLDSLVSPLLCNDWWELSPIVMISGCSWEDTGGAQRPVALSRRLIQQGHPVIYYSESKSGKKTGYIDGVLVLPPYTMEDFLKFVSFKNIKGTVVVTLANYYHYIEIFKQLGWTIIYDLLDDWDAFQNSGDLPKNDIYFRELELIDAADIITCSAPDLRDRIAKMKNKNAILLPNGGPKQILPRCIPNNNMYKSKNIFIYSGYLEGSWLDWECFNILEENEIIGNIVGKYIKVPDYKYLNFVGEKPYPIAATYIAASHAGIIPFKDKKICESVDPIKAYDYWAAGLWIVATPVMKVLFDKPYTIIADKHDFPEAIQEAYAQFDKNPPTPEFVSQNSWEARAKDLSQIINKQHKKTKVYRVSKKFNLQEEDCPLRVTLQMPSSCNMEPPCPYCSNAAFRKGKPPIQGDPNLWLDGLTWIGEEYGPMYISLCFGDPLSDKDTIAITSELALGNKVDLVSNIICPLEDLEILPRNGNVAIATSFHPYHWSLDEFLEKREQIVNSGIRCGCVLIVGYPPKIDQIPIWVEQLDSLGIETRVMPFHGMYKQKEYPSSYNEDEKKIVFSEVEKIYKKSDWLLNSPKGKKCRVGKDYLFIDEYGDIHACYMGQSKIGNVFDKNIELVDDFICSFDVCPCPDMWEYLEE